ncbi:Uncharacterised protein [Mycobacteroides abscessus subsp. massiliense]|nr:Uncharacterised protein [Mycobacteroides abscessus subsp. massiliense]
MWRDDEVGQSGFQQRVAVAWRLLCQYVKTCTADLAVFQRRNQSGFINQAAAPAVDEDGAGFHLLQFGFAYHVGRLRRERTIKRYDIGGADGFVKGNIAVADALGIFMFGEHDIHFESLSISCQRFTDIAATENRQRFAV